MPLFSLDYVTPLFIVLMVVFVCREASTTYLPLKYLLTPLITAGIIGIVIVSIYHNGINNYRVLILTALILALIADTMLMIEEVDLLKYGIVFFLLAHFLYIAAFSRGFYFERWNFLVLAVLLLFFIIYYLIFKGKTGGMDLAVFAYIITIFTVVFFVFSRLNAGVHRPAMLAAIGGVFFLVSDTLLAINAFLRPIPRSTVFTWATYCPAQLLIALSCFG
ncbi:MAG: lysoplasmalogenase [bacterium]|nr:lysoplasmalogenase [bacterium]